MRTLSNRDLGDECRSAEMPQREKTATVDLKVRMKEHLREQIEATAGERGVSLNAEAVARLERSFREDWIIEQIRQIVAPGVPA